jgi:hypothetical protein
VTLVGIAGYVQLLPLQENAATERLLFAFPALDIPIAPIGTVILASSQQRAPE